MRIVTVLLVLVLFCSLAQATDTSVMINGSMNYSMGLNTPNEWTYSLRWNLSDMIVFATSVDLAPHIPGTPRLARGGSNIDPFTLQFTAPEGQRGTVNIGTTTLINWHYANINNMATTNLVIDLPAHGIPKFKPNQTSMSVTVPFTMHGTVNLFMAFSPFAAPSLTREIVGSGTANLSYSRLNSTTQPTAFRRMPHPPVVLSAITFTLAPPPLAKL
ncbi:MAG: hypothetical protein ABIP75_15535 [Pyrinomonadaceae bacterium]